VRTKGDELDQKLVRPPQQESLEKPRFVGLDDLMGHDIGSKHLTRGREQSCNGDGQQHPEEPVHLEGPVGFDEVDHPAHDGLEGSVEIDLTPQEEQSGAKLLFLSEFVGHQGGDIVAE